MKMNELWSESFDSKCFNMIQVQLKQRGIRDPRVLDAMKQVPRHCFVAEELRIHAYADQPLPIGEGQTISQPFVVALMLVSACIPRGGRVLEVGSGCGYVLAVLSEMGCETFGIEYRDHLFKMTNETFCALDCQNIEMLHGDGAFGWGEKAPFDTILVSAASPRIPDALIKQLKTGGTLVIPVEVGANQELKVFVKKEDGLIEKNTFPVRFVPLIGQVRQP